MEQEIWKDIPGYEGRYQASTLGRIRSLDCEVTIRHYKSKKPFTRKFKGQVLQPGRYCKGGHLSVVLGKRTPGRPVHQLVMQTFVGTCPPGMEVCHNNGDPTDNRLENLRYATRRDNILDVYWQGKRWRKLNIDDVSYIRFALYCGVPARELASKFKVSETTISRIKLRRSYSWLR